MEISGRVLGIAVAMALMTTIPAKANLLTNGSFETGPDPGSFTNLASGSTVITGWTVALGDIDYIGTIWVSSDGKRSLDLEGSPVIGGTCDIVTPHCPGGIKQDFSTVASQQYQVTFDLAGNPNPSSVAGVPVIKTVLVSAAGQSQTFTFDTTGHSLSSMGWVTDSWTFTASGTTTTLEFDSADSPATGFGPALDNVSVNAIESAIPEPEIYAMMAVGLGLLSWVGRRRKQIGATA